MVAISFAMIFTGVVALLLYFRKRLFNKPIFQWWCMIMAPAGFVAVLAGWFVTEVGRQPWVAYGILRTSDTISPLVAEQVLITLITFIVVYSFIFGAGSHYILKLIRKGPKVMQENENYYGHSMESSVTKAVLEGRPK